MSVLGTRSNLLTESRDWIDDAHWTAPLVDKQILGSVNEKKDDVNLPDKPVPEDINTMCEQFFNKKGMMHRSGTSLSFGRGKN